MRVYFRFLRQALAERIFSPRMYAVAFLHGFLLHFYMRAVVRFSIDMECAATPWAFCQMYFTICGRFAPNEGRIAGYVT